MKNKKNIFAGYFVKSIEDGFQVSRCIRSSKDDNWVETEDKFIVTNNLEIKGCYFPLENITPVSPYLFSCLREISKELADIIDNKVARFDSMMRFFMSRTSYARPTKKKSENYCIIQRGKYSHIAVARIFYIQDDQFISVADKFFDNCNVKYAEEYYYKRMYGKIVFIQKGLIENTRLKYFKDEIEMAKKDDFGLYCLYTMFNNSVIESLLKCSYKNISNRIKQNLRDGQTPQAILCRMFQNILYHFRRFVREEPVDYAHKQLHQILEIPSCGLAFLDDKIAEGKRDNILAEIKGIFGTINPEYFKRMNREELDEISETIEDHSRRISWETNHILKELVDVYGISNFKNLFKYVVDLERMDLDSSTLYMYRDYLRMKHQLGERAEWKIYDFTEIRKWHDELTERLNKERIEKENISFQNISLSQYEYQGNIFSVVAPKTAEEIRKEGASLHHCVASYISSVCSQKTYILFVRKNEDISSPFFTMEVRNGKIRQCRGVCNKNPSEENGLLSFLKEYGKVTGLEIEGMNTRF